MITFLSTVYFIFIGRLFTILYRSDYIFITFLDVRWQMFFIGLHVSGFYGPVLNLSKNLKCIVSI